MSDLAPLDDQLRHLSSATPTSDKARSVLRELIDSLLDDRLQIMASRRPKVKCSTESAANLWRRLSVHSAGAVG